jgi:2'-5' RNA ligase
MNKAVLFFAFAFAFFFTPASFADDLLIKFDIYEHRKVKIHNDIVKNTGLHKKEPDNYHLTVALIKDVDPLDFKALSTFLKEALTLKRPDDIEIQLKDFGCYDVGSHRKEVNNQPIVTYPDAKSYGDLVALNKHLYEHMQTFKSPSGKKYAFFDETTPGTYKPHITIANKKYINDQKADRADVLAKLTRNLQQHKVYKFMLYFK